MFRNEFRDEIREGEGVSGREWYALHVRSRHEKLVATQLEALGVSHWLPLLETRRRWSDRYKVIQEPLFPGYVFVHVADDEQADVYDARGVVRLVGFNGKPCSIPAKSIEAVRTAMEASMKCDPYPGLHPGREVIVIRGPLKGYAGVLIRREGKHRLLLAVEAIGQSMSVEIFAGDVEIVRQGAIGSGAGEGAQP